MYRIIFVVLLHIAFSSACRPPPCHWTAADAKPIENYFDAVARKVIAADRKVQEFCNRQGWANIQEIHSRTDYKLVISGGGYATYDIKVRDRVLLILSENCQNSMADLRILPPYVSGSRGSYCSQAGDLVLTFPLKYDAAIGGGKCEEVNRNTFTLYQNCNIIY